MEALPLDAWLLIDRHGLAQRDVASLACASRGLRDAMRAVFDHRGVSVRHGACEAALARRPHLTALTVRGWPLRYGAAVGVPRPLRLPALPRLASLHLHHPRLPDAPFWPAVLAACPALVDVKLAGDFYMSNYARDLRHCIDLVALGAPRLRSLDVEGGWLVLYRVASGELSDVADAVRAARTLPTVRSTTLTRLRAACKQLPAAVDAPLTHLDVDEPNERPLVAERIGPAAHATLRHLVWRGYWPLFDARPLGRFGGLVSAEISVLSVSTVERMEACLATLAGLPPSLRRLRLRLDLWLLRTHDSCVEWGAPLRHLRALEHVELDMLFPPDSVASLLGSWLGAGGPALRTAVARFHEPASWCIEEELERLRDFEDACSDDEQVQELMDLWDAANQPVPGCELCAWLDRDAPRAVATVHNFPRLVCSHPRCRVLPGPAA
jgi:hypothetical protein